MTAIRFSTSGLFALLFLFAVPWALSAQDHGEQLSGRHLESLLPDDLDGYTVADVTVQESSPSVLAIYQSDAGEESIRYAITYGKEAAERYRRSRGKIVLAEAEGKMEVGEISVQDRTITVAQMGPKLIAMTYFNHFLVGATAENLKDPEPALGDFFEKVGLDRFAEWSPPEGVEYTVDETVTDAPDCFDMDCFSEYVSRCERGQLVGALGRRITAKYTVEEQLADDQCRISLVYTDNPNSEWENTPLYFTVDPSEDFTMETVKAVMEECVEGEGASQNCEGPLLDHMKDR